MGRWKAYDETGREVWIHDSYLDNAVNDELERMGYSDQGQELAKVKEQLGNALKLIHRYEQEMPLNDRR